MLKKKRKKEVDALATKYNGISIEVALTLQTQIDKEEGLGEKIKCLQAGLLAFYLLIRDMEEKVN